METLTKERIDTVISEIRSELAHFDFDPAHLERFGTVDKNLDEICLSYMQGNGGYFAKFLALLVKKLSFENIVELGNQKGFSTIAIYDQLPKNSRFSTIDIVEDVRYCPQKMFRDPRVHFIYGDVCDVDVFSKLKDSIDFLYSDTIHYDFQIRDEFDIYQHLLSDRALVAIDDIYLNDKGRFWDEVPYDKWDLSELCHQSGWGLFLYVRDDKTDNDSRLMSAITASSKIWQRKYDEKRSILDRIRERSFAVHVKKLLKAIPVLYPLYCKINNRFRLFKIDTRP